MTYIPSQNEENCPVESDEGTLGPTYPIIATKNLKRGGRGGGGGGKGEEGSGERGVKEEAKMANEGRGEVRKGEDNNPHEVGEFYPDG